MPQWYDVGMLKVLVATPLYPPEIGGPATYAHALEAELPKHDIAVTILPFAHARRWPKVIRHIVYFWQVYQSAKCHDVVYALDSVSVGLPAALAAKRVKKTFLVRVPGDYAWEQGQVRFGVTATLDTFITQKKQRLPVRVLQRIQSWVANQAVKVIVPSVYMKQVVVSWGVHPASIVPIYSALYPLPVTEDRSAIRTQLGYTGTVLVSAGRLVPWKGFETLIEIIPEIRKRIPDVQLVIIGDGPLRASLETRTRQLGLSETVRFFDRQPKTALGAALVAADVFVLNTAYEGLSHQLLEVMALGTPIVTTHVGGNSELIKDAVTGVLVPFDDRRELTEAIIRVATHDSFRQSLVHNAKLRVKDFEQRTVLRDLVEVLESIV